MSCHLCCNFSRNDDGTLHFTPRKHIEKMIDFYLSMFGSKSKLNVMSPLEKGDHTELDTSECLDQNSVQKFQSLAGVIQWVASLVD